MTPTSSASSGQTFSFKSVFKIAGAFIAWVIGSGFATGQEVLQFFSSYGYNSFWIVLINLAGFIGLGFFWMKIGLEQKDTPNFDHFRFLCGKKVGTAFTWLVTATMLFLLPVLVSAGGATLQEYYGVNAHLGSAIIALLVLLIYLIGFERMTKIISCIGPVVIAFSLLVGIISVIRDIGSWGDIASYEPVLSQHHAAPHWLLSGILYLGLNLFPGSSYFVRLGSTAASKREIKYGAILGSVLLLLSITVMNTAILLNGNVVANLDIPTLYLAQKISRVLGGIFSIVLLLGIFSSSSVMMWTVCSRFHFKQNKWNVLAALGVTIFAYIVGLFSFGDLVAAIYPVIGYIGFAFFIFVGIHGIMKKRQDKNKLKVKQ